MKVKRAVYTGAILWLVSFALGIIIFYMYGSPNDSGDITGNAPPVALSYSLIVIVVGLASYYYFCDVDKKDNWREGLYLGLMFVGVGTVLDAIMLLVFFLSGRSITDLAAYYATPLFFVSVILIVSTCMFMGYLRKRIKF